MEYQNKKPYGAKKSEGSKGYEKKSFGEKSYAKKSGDYRSFDRDGNQKPFEKKPFEKKPFDKNRSEKKPYEKKSFEKKPYERKPFEDRKNDAYLHREEDVRYEKKNAFIEEDAKEPELENGAVIGRNAVRELLKSGRPIDKMLVQKGERTGSIVVLVAQAIERGIPVIETEKSKLDAMAGFAPHQGVIAMAAEKEYCSIEDILQVAKDRGEEPLIVLCDGVTDPYNLGAIIRCAECCGAHGLIIPKRRAVGLTPLVTKSSAGAIEHLAIAKVSNLNSAIETLKDHGVWVFAAEAGGSDLYKTNLHGGCAIVMGSEGEGVSQLVKKNCDGIISIPIYGQVNSFNVSTAAAIILAEAAKQHHEEK